jgi:hypothetical protein
MAVDPAAFQSFVQRLVDFYGDSARTGPKSVGFDANAGGILGLASGNRISINPELRARLETLFASPRSKAAGAQGIEALGTLIHEALHTRGNGEGQGVRDPSTGLYGPGDEWQAHQLGYSLVPDAMQRYFGIDPDSPVGQFYQQLAQGRGYSGTLGGPGAARVQGGVPDRIFYL